MRGIIKKLTLPVLLIGALNCSTANTVNKVEGLEKVLKPEIVKEIKDSEPVKIIIDAQEIFKDMPADKLIENGFVSYYSNDYVGAAYFFNKAISTGDLNEAGRAVSYWHIGTAYKKLDDSDNACEAFYSFINVADKVMEMREIKRFAEIEGKDFVDNFRLNEKLVDANAEINSTWAKRADYFGRTPENCIPVKSSDEVEKFLDLIDDCPKKRETVIEVQPGNMYHAVLDCEQTGDSDEFYFQLVSDKSAE